MRPMIIGDLKTHFSQVIKNVKSGEEIAVTFGRKKEIVAYLIPKAARIGAKRQLDILQGKGTVTFADDFKLTNDEFLGL